MAQSTTRNVLWVRKFTLTVFTLPDDNIARTCWWCGRAARYSTGMGIFFCDYSISDILSGEHKLLPIEDGIVDWDTVPSPFQESAPITERSATPPSNPYHPEDLAKYDEPVDSEFLAGWLDKLARGV